MHSQLLLWTQISVELYVPVALIPEMSPPLRNCWVGPRVRLNAGEMSPCLCRESIRGRPADSVNVRNCN
jgi:hypothetical protein